MKNKLNLIAAILIGFLILGNPTESRYFNRLQVDYGKIHQGSVLSIQDLNHMGKSKVTSYLLWGFFEYSFGTIQVKYFGIGFMTFFIGSNNSASPQTLPEQSIT